VTLGIHACTSNVAGLLLMAPIFIVPLCGAHEQLRCKNGTFLGIT
jgi:hypothetical protein